MLNVVQQQKLYTRESDLKSLLGVRKSVATHMVLAELGRFPLQIHFWLRVLRYHHRTMHLTMHDLSKLQWLMAQTAVN